MNISTSERQLRALVRDMVSEVLEEKLEQKKDIIIGLISEVLEDIALSKAIDEGMKTALVSEEEIFKFLE